MTYQLITISGQLGSGKSTVAKIIAQKLGWAHYSTGMAQRQIAEKYGVSTLELNKRAESDTSIDKEIDGIYQHKPWGKTPCVIDSRLAFHFLPESFKVKLKVSSKEAAKRIFNEARPKEKYTSIQECEEALTHRSELERNRFKRIYQVDIFDDTLFDLLIDTTALSPQEVAEKIMKNL